ncbi:methyltransferase domain-containing protein [Frankia sp. AgPm24]|uniref:methyltransferase domain-containing protein n=1 Tax=Frankia sp. AgPm24 TaxID=631128 RepID=UPI00200F0FD8|nr:methyltransferase domain-containing protein [Frankia sp. AgPm24]MCK9922008.1 methyltransferase domain-containing protein [Frankia sp. AgPm24]
MTGAREDLEPRSGTSREAVRATSSIHELLADLALEGTAGTVVDLGAGKGPTLAEIARRSPDSALTALDVDESALAQLALRLPEARIVRHDLADPLPLPDAGIDVVVSHNTLECLTEPAALVADIARVLRPGGRAVLGHTDFETIAVTVDDRDLARRVLLTYAELPVPYQHMAAADPQTGRRLPGLIRRSPLHLEAVHAHTTVVATLPEAMDLRLREVHTAVRRSTERGLGHVTTKETDAWLDQLHAAETTGDFLFSETAFVVTASRPT